MLDFDAIIQFIPINGETAWFNRPFDALLRRGLRQPFEPIHLVNRQANLTSIAEKNAQYIGFKTNFFCLNLSVNTKG